MGIVSREESNARRDAFVFQPLRVPALQGMAHRPGVEMRLGMVARRSVQLRSRTAQEQALLTLRDEACRHSATSPAQSR